MKKIFLLYAIIIASLSYAYAQTDACHGDWGPWQNVYTFEHNVNFRISFKYLLTDKKGCMESYYRFDNPVSKPGAYLNFKFSYKKTDGTVGVQTFAHVELDRAGLKQVNSSNWYLGYDMIKIYDIQYFDPANDKNTTDTDLGLKPQPLAKQSHADSVKAGLPKPKGDAMGRRADNTTTPAGQPVVQSAALSNENPARAQKQQYQQQANAYLNAAHNDNDNQIQQSLNVNLAKINATASGNKAQVAQIQQLQNQQMQQNINNLENQLSDIINKPKPTKEYHKLTKEEQDADIDRRLRAQMEKDGYVFDANGKTIGLPGDPTGETLKAANTNNRPFQANVDLAYTELLKSINNPKPFYTKSHVSNEEEKVNEIKKWILNKLESNPGKMVTTFSDNTTFVDNFVIDKSKTDDKEISLLCYNKENNEDNKAIIDRVNIIYSYINWASVIAVKFDHNGIIKTTAFPASIELTTLPNQIKLEVKSISYSKLDPDESRLVNKCVFYFNDTTEPDLGARLVKAFNDIIAYYKKNKPKELY